MDDSMRQKRKERMLQLVEERLSAYTVEETIEKLHSYEEKGPTLDEFSKSLENKE